MSKSELLDQAPRHNLRIEEEAIQACLTGRTDRIGILFTSLTPDDFHDPFHKEMFRGLQIAWNAGVPFDTPGSLTEVLAATGLMKVLEEHAGGGRTAAEAVAIVMASQAAPANAEFYVSVLRALTLRRGLVRMAIELIRRAYDETVPTAGTLAWAAEQIERANAGAR